MIPVEEWTHVGSSENAEFYVIEPEILAVVPNVDVHDDEHTARQSLAFQTKHWEKVGYRGAAVIFMDRVLSQDGSARTVYETETSTMLTTCFALVGATFFGLATAAPFEGFTKPGIPTQIFRSLEDARPWIAEMNKARGGKL
ncbi:MAG: hypothetical protein JWP87_541 [Labilithrix sp.]|nr:hypothetical protein [Labilithrix sp.]